MESHHVGLVKPSPIATRAATRRVVSVWLPTWPTDRLRRHRADAPPPDRPFVTAWHDGRRRIVAAPDQAAARLGLHAGMPLAHAQAMVSGLTIAEADPEGDTAALADAAAWCLRYTPLAAPDPPDGLWLDTTGCAHLSGGERAMLEDLRARFARAGIAARVAVADAPGSPGRRPSWRRRGHRRAARRRRAGAGAAARCSPSAAGGSHCRTAPSWLRYSRAACGGAARAAPPALRRGGAAPARSGIRPGVRADHAGGSGRGGRAPACLRRAAADDRGVRRSDRAARARRLRRAGTDRPGRAAARSGVRARGRHDPGRADRHRAAELRRRIWCGC